ncbi:RNA 2',3'-cyclic phosphodiesterase [Candidatus Daviesbacteria bacterium]|nr:RNA 2',3'-cyclic phosphodiesterase [Candidatus Daviesbacteria bacterium]
MRFFIALDIPDESTRQIIAIQNNLKTILPGVSLTYPEKFHLTLAFVGEQLEELKEPLVKVLKNSAKEIPPFSVIPCCLDGFPHFHSANVLWLGVKGEIDKLIKIRHHIKDGLTRLGLNTDPRRFIPHIAIAKAKDLKISFEQEKLLEKIIPDNLDPILVDSIKLYESIESGGFHSHNTLAEIKLG